MRVNTSGVARKVILASSILFALSSAGSLALYFKNKNNNPLPSAIKNQLSFKALYPPSASSLIKIDSASYNYQASDKVLTFTVNYAGSDVIFSQQPAPDSLGSGKDVYYQVLGIHPYAQFKTNLGLVALTKFFKTGDLKPSGQSGVLATEGTLLTANTTGNLTNEQWKDLFNSLSISK